MTVETENNFVVHRGNGAATIFPYNFTIPSEDTVIVTVLDWESKKPISVLTPDQFTISGVGGEGGSVTYSPPGGPLPFTQGILISRRVPYVQDLTLTNEGGFYPESLEHQLDLIVMQVQQLLEELSRTPKLREGSASLGVVIEEPITGRVLGWDNEGNLTALINSAAEAEVIVDEVRGYRDETLLAYEATVLASDLALDAAEDAENAANLAVDEAALAQAAAEAADLSAIAAGGYKDAAASAAGVVGNYDTLALANADLANIPENGGVSILNDSPNNGFYVKQSGVLVKKSDTTLAGLITVTADIYDPRIVPPAGGDNLLGLSESPDPESRTPLVTGSGVEVSSASLSGRNLQIDPLVKIFSRTLVPVARDTVFELEARVSAGSGGLTVGPVELGVRVFNGLDVFLRDLVLETYPPFTGEWYKFTGRFTAFPRSAPSDERVMDLGNGAAYALPYVRLAGGSNPLYINFMGVKVAEFDRPSDLPLSPSSSLFQFEDAEGQVQAEIAGDGDYVFGGGKKASGLFSLTGTDQPTSPILPNIAQMTDEFLGVMGNLTAWKGSSAVAPVPKGQVGERWKLSNVPAFLATSIPYSEVTQGIEIDTPYFPDDQVVHPFALEFYGSWLGQEKLMVVTPYNGTGDPYENPFIFGTEDFTQFTYLDGPLSQPEGSPTANYNSDPFVYYDFHQGSLVVGWRNGGTVAGFDLRAMRTKDGVHWSAPYTLHPNEPTALLLSPSVQYIPSVDRYIMYAVVTIGGTNQFAYRVMRADGSYQGGWQSVATPWPAVWHAEVRRVGEGFVGIFNDNYTSNQLYLGYSEDGWNWQFSSTPLLSGTIEPTYKATVGIEVSDTSVELTFLWTSSDQGSLAPEERWRLKLVRRSFPIERT